MAEREQMECDVVIVGGGPAGLAAACQLGKLARDHELPLTICLVEKGAEPGAHILSGAIIETTALSELFPDWKNLNTPLETQVTRDEFHLLTGTKKSLKLPSTLLPESLHNQGNYVVSLGNFCRWLAEQAEALGIEIFPGFAATETLYNEDGSVGGIATGDMGRNRNGDEKDNFQHGYELRAKYTLFAEGCRGHLGKELITRFSLDLNASPQHYALGIKEVWQVPEEQHEPGKVIHGMGWPLGFGKTTGGSFLYHLGNNQVAAGLITDLNYTNPWFDPFREFQRMKHHPLFSAVLKGGNRLGYGARALVKGGLNSLPESVVPGAVLIGDNAGTLNFLKIKGTHTAMKSGMLAAEAVFANLKKDLPHALTDYSDRFKGSWLYRELHQSRNSSAAQHRFGTLLGAAYTFLEQKLFLGKLPLNLRDKHPDHTGMKTIDSARKIHYPAPDNELSFDRSSSVYLANISHDEDQPCHLLLKDETVPVVSNLPLFDEPAQRYCPAGVYEIVEQNGVKQLQINAQNCIHCKTCDIKDPSANIIWVAPEGGSGPNYTDM